MKFLLYPLLVLLSLSVYSQTEKPKKQTFEFFHSRKDKVVSVQEGKYLEIELNKPDTTHTLWGDLQGLTDSTLIVNLSWEEKVVSQSGYEFRQDIDYYEEKLVHIPLRTIESLYLEKKGSQIAAYTGAIGLVSALIVAPLASIDRRKPYSFNAKRYRWIAIPSAGVALVGFSVYGIIGNDKKLRVKFSSL